mgnify:CR=1 FL=1
MNYAVVASRTIATSFPSITISKRVSIACITDFVVFIAKFAVVSDQGLIGNFENSGLFRGLAFVTKMCFVSQPVNCSKWR